MTLKLQSPRNGALRVNLQLWIPSEKTFVLLPSVFDTGACKTIISTKVAKHLMLDMSQSSSYSTVTAGGALHLNMGTLPKIKVGTLEINNVPVLIADLPPELESHCVLGMNVLREFLITIDSIGRTIPLTHRPYPKKYHQENYSVSMLADAADLESNLCTKQIRYMVIKLVS